VRTGDGESGPYKYLIPSGARDLAEVALESGVSLKFQDSESRSLAALGMR
jgi:hypothetical protein